MENAAGRLHRNPQPLLKHAHAQHDTRILNDVINDTLHDRRTHSKVPAFLRHGFASRLTSRQAECRQENGLRMSQWRRLEPAVEAPSTSNILSRYLFLPRF